MCSFTSRFNVPFISYVAFLTFTGNSGNSFTPINIGIVYDNATAIQAADGEFVRRMCWNVKNEYSLAYDLCSWSRHLRVESMSQSLFLKKAH